MNACITGGRSAARCSAAPLSAQRSRQPRAKKAPAPLHTAQAGFGGLQIATPTLADAFPWLLDHPVPTLALAVVAAIVIPRILKVSPAAQLFTSVPRTPPSLIHCNTSGHTGAIRRVLTEFELHMPLDADADWARLSSAGHHVLLANPDCVHCPRLVNVLCRSSGAQLSFLPSSSWPLRRSLTLPRPPGTASRRSARAQRAW